ncbi:MAG TPA: D-2-hydroxyacid dehydrogenase [Clostridia bacterium]|nr:D-2-hydroxyacid dehydrogenase [Clostridia bacterium]
MNIISTIGLEEKLRKQLVERCPNDVIRHEQLSSLSDGELKEIDGLITFGNDIPVPVIDKMPKLSWIHIAQSGINDLPFDKLIEREIIVTTSKGINSITIAEYVIGMMINVIRNNYTFYQAQKRGEWDFNTTLDEIYGRTLGIIGLGMVGKEIAKRGKALGMRVIALEKFKIENPENVDQLILHDEKELIFRESDFIVTSLPLTDETLHFVDEKELSLMKPTSYLINVGRGPVVNESALINTLKARKIAGAVLDVFEVEPLPKESELWSLDNVILTPHVAGDRQSSYYQRVLDLFYYNLEKYPESGKMKNVPNLKLGF